MKKNTLIFYISSIMISFLLGVCFYLAGSWSMQPQKTVLYNQTSVGEITQVLRVTTLPATSTYATMDATPSNYECIKLRRLDGNNLTFCVRKKPLILKKEYNVRGMYVVDTDTIYLDKNSPTDRILHELAHGISSYKNGILGEEEKAYQLQSFYVQLVALKIIK